MTVPQQSPSLSVVIPNYNGKELLAECLAPTLQSIFKDVPDAEVIIVDDCSTDDSCDWITKNYPHIKLLVNAQNCGFGGTVNRGCREAGGELLLLLNTDVIVLEHCVRAALPHFDDPAVFGVTFQALRPDRVFREGANRISLKSGLPYTHHNPQDWYLDERGRTRASYPVGGHAIIRRQMFDSLKGFSPLFEPFYSEDADLGLRAHRQNWITIYEADAAVIHNEKGSIKSHFKQQFIQHIRRRNRFLLLLNAYPATVIVLQVPLLLIRLLVDLLKLQWRDWRALGAAIKRLRAVK